MEDTATCLADAFDFGKKSPAESPTSDSLGATREATAKAVGVVAEVPVAPVKTESSPPQAAAYFGIFDGAANRSAIFVPTRSVGRTCQFCL